MRREKVTAGLFCLMSSSLELITVLCCVGLYCFELNCIVFLFVFVMFLGLLFMYANFVFHKVHMVSYQCSPLSTAEGIVATFRQCGKLQKGKNPDKFVSVVVLDEVGLAEDSPLMPLKTLHPLLEDGFSSTDDIIEVEEQFPQRVAFVGISNWALDPAKMNRGIMLSRGLPDTEELVESAM